MPSDKNQKQDLGHLASRSPQLLMELRQSKDGKEAKGVRMTLTGVGGHYHYEERTPLPALESAEACIKWVAWALDNAGVPANEVDVFIQPQRGPRKGPLSLREWLAAIGAGIRAVPYLPARDSILRRLP